MARERALLRVVSLYVHLLIVEGAFRKWVPGTEQIMYVARDGLLIAGAVYISLFYGPAKAGRRVAAYWIAVAGFCFFVLLQALFRDAPLLVSVAGLRNYLAPTFLIYLVWANNLTASYDRIRLIIAGYTPVLALIAIAQVASPRGSVLNRQVGGSDEGVFTTADGVVRATGTFTSSVGMASFATLSFAVGVTFLFGEKKRFLGLLACVAAFTIVAIGGSRSAVLGAAVVAAVVLIQQAVAARSKTAIRIVGLGVVLAGVWALVLFAFPQVVSAFGTRFERAAQSENALTRVIENTVSMFSVPITTFGAGAGGHSAFGINTGSGLTWIEDDAARWVAELGVLGFFLAAIRLAAAASLLVVAITRPVKTGSERMALGAFLVPILAYGSITALPTVQGLFAIGATLLLMAPADLNRAQSATSTSAGRSAAVPRSEANSLGH